MSPTIFKENGFRFFFFSREEPRIHVHVSHADGEAKFWLTPEVIIAVNYGLSDQQINAVKKSVILHYEEITNAWNTHFSD
jgi:hypothetical protein